MKNLVVIQIFNSAMLNMLLICYVCSQGGYNQY